MAVEAAFLVAVPTVVGVALGAGKWTIVAASGVAYLLIVLVEAFLWYGGKRVPQMPARPFRRPPSVIVHRRGDEGAVADDDAPVVVRRPEPEPQPEAFPAPTEPFPAAEAPEPEQAPAPEPQPEPEPAAPAPAPHEHVRVLRRESEPEPEPVERAPLVAVPELEPEPVSESVGAPAQLQPAAAASTVVPIGVGSAPRRWNLWDLERLTRDASGSDPARDEERTFLLMYLREFADADGLLPVDFDGLVRDSFGDLVG
jgi:outer membrane biosynthesis protein TonB